MKSLLPAQLGSDRAMMMQLRARSVTAIRAHGTQRIPAPTRGVVAQPAQNGVLLTWHLPSRYNDVTGYRIYTGSEKNISIQIRDRGARQVFVPLASGGSPAKQNIFVSAVNGFKEGPRQQIQVAALDNGTATTQVVPLPAFDFLDQFSGGLDKTQSGRPSGKKVL